MTRSMMILVCVWGVSCGGGEITSTTDSASDAPTVDITPSDTAPNPPSGDVTGQDTVLIPDASTCEAGTGCFGDKCSGPDDCNSSICTNHLGDTVCSKTCDADCPAGWTCTLVGAAGSDGQYVCMSNFPALCLPCKDAGDCASTSPNACVKYPGGASFCGGGCGVENPCPEGYSCQNAETVSGSTTYQCIPDSGICECSSLAIAAALATPCSIENESGVCEGIRVCTDQGLAACDATVPAEEICDGIDNDCNGLVDESTCDDGNPCTEDSCDGANGCINTPIDSGECLDGNACTQGDHCEAGVCVGEALVCADDNPCTTDDCDTETGCTYTPNTLACDDGEACTFSDICQEGACVSGTLISCSDDNPCTDDACGETGCTFTANDALACDDGSTCTLASACQAGACVGTEPLVCDDANPCTTDACDPGTGCTHTPNTAPCDDGTVCTLGDTCADGVCTAGAEVLVCSDGNVCTDDNCDAALGCTFTANSDLCDDGNACTVNETCQDGGCKAASSLACDDSNACTTDSCDPATGCVHTPTALPCSDGDACTTADTCADGVCTGTPTSCDDGFYCNGAETCDPATGCTPGTPPNLDDGIDCTLDSCDEATQTVLHTPMNQVCDNGLFCDGQEVCSADTGCVAGEAPVIDDGIDCTQDVCDEEADVVTHNPVDADCDNGLFCDGIETCNLITGCSAGDPATEDDGIACTQDVCDEDTDSFQHVPDDSLCPPAGLCETAVCGSISGCIAQKTPNCCGNNDIEPGETCDDGNDQDGDGCDSNCQSEAVNAPECQNYQVLNENWRNVSFNDGNGGIEFCDNGLSGWYRFQGEAGTQMPTQCPSKFDCGTDAPGWMQGSHPSVEEGATTRTVCFHWNSGCCSWSQNIQVRNCGNFFVYELNGTPACHLAYCAQ